MKKYLVLSVFSLFIFVGLSSSINSDPPIHTNCNDLCAYLVDVGISPNQGTCQSICATCLNPGQGSGKVATCICSILDELDILPEGVPHGQCVKRVKNRLEG